MDPDAALKEIRELVRQVIACQGDQAATAVQLAERVEGLDEWIRMGGFLPEDWRD